VFISSRSGGGAEIVHLYQFVSRDVRSRSRGGEEGGSGLVMVFDDKVEVGFCFLTVDDLDMFRGKLLSSV